MKVLSILLLMSTFSSFALAQSYVRAIDSKTKLLNLPSESKIEVSRSINLDKWTSSIDLTGQCKLSYKRILEDSVLEESSELIVEDISLNYVRASLDVHAKAMFSKFYEDLLISERDEVKKKVRDANRKERKLALENGNYRLNMKSKSGTDFKIRCSGVKSTKEFAEGIGPDLIMYERVSRKVL